MKRITIYTSKYKSELTTFANTVSENKLCTVAGNQAQVHTDGIKFSWENSATGDFVCALLRLLQTIVMLENPVYKHSPKLRGLAEELDSSYQAKELKTFIKESKHLHLEGYAAFRMEEYHAKLDTMLYTIVKKINLGK